MDEEDSRLGSHAKADRGPPSVLVDAFERSLEAVFVGVPDGRILFANRAACDLFGVSEAELIRLGSQGICDSEDPRWKAALSERALHGWVRATLPMTRADGSRFWADVASALFVEAEGLMSWVNVRDVTEQVRMQRRLVAYDEVAEALLRQREIADVLALVARHARIIFDADEASIVTPLGTGDGFVVAAADGPEMSGFVGAIYPPESLSEEVFESGQPILVQDLTAVTRTEQGRKMGLGPAMVVPIATEGPTLGVLWVGAKRGSHPYDQDDLAQATDYAQRAGVVLAVGQARAELERCHQQTSEQLQTALDTRIVIEQAKGFIAATRDIDTEEAFQRLRSYARSHNTRVQDVASAVLRRQLLL